MVNKNVIIAFILGLLCFISAGVIHYRNRTIAKPITISTSKEIPISQEIKTLVPNAKKAFTNIPEVIPVGKKLTETIVETSDNQVKVISTLTNSYGWYKGLGLYGGINLTGLDYGLNIRGPNYWKVGLDCLLGGKSSGIGIGYETSRNSEIGISYTYNYQTFTPQPELFLSLGF